MYRGRPVWHAAEKQLDALSYCPQRGRSWNGGSARPLSRQSWPAGGKSSCCWPLGPPNPTWPSRLVCSGWSPTRGSNGFSASAWMASLTLPTAVPRAVFPEVAIHLEHLACERPDALGRSFSQWDCGELACHLVAEGIVMDISASTVRRLLRSHQLKPWRHHLWFLLKKLRDATVSDIVDLYTRLLREDAVVLSVAEKPSLQPRPRWYPPRPRIFLTAASTRICAGALNLFAAYATRSGQILQGVLCTHTVAGMHRLSETLGPRD